MPQMRLAFGAQLAASKRHGACINESAKTGLRRRKIARIQACRWNFDPIDYPSRWTLRFSVLLYLLFGEMVIGSTTAWFHAGVVMRSAEPNA
jgi:hypothetical protein